MKSYVEKTKLRIYLLHNTETILRRILADKFEEWKMSLPDLISKSGFLTGMYLSDYRFVRVNNDYDAILRVGPFDGAHRVEKAFMVILVVPSSGRKLSPIRGIFSWMYARQIKK